MKSPLVGVLWEKRSMSCMSCDRYKTCFSVLWTLKRINHTMGGQGIEQTQGDTQMLTRNFVHYVVLVVLGVGVLSTGAQMSSADASDDYWVQGRGIDTEDGEKQQALLTALMAEFKRFDQLYEKRQAGQEITAQQWLDMAQRFEAFEGHEITSDRTGISPHLLRAQLLQGQADLLASMVLYHKGASDEEFFGAYHRGLDTLETLLRLVNDDIDYLPRYSFMYKPDSQKTWEVRVNPYAGYETIGTGVVYSGPDNRRLDAPQRVTQYDYEGYKSLEVYAGYVEAELNEIGATLRTDIPIRIGRAA